MLRDTVKLRNFHQIESCKKGQFRKLNLANILIKVSKFDRRLLQLLLDLGCFFSILVDNFLAICNASLVASRYLVQVSFCDNSLSTVFLCQVDAMNWWSVDGHLGAEVTHK